MRWWKYYIILLLALFDLTPLKAQTISQNSANAILMIEEPKITLGTSNIVFSENTFGAKTFLFKLETATKWDTIASSGNPSQFSEIIGGLQSGMNYQYRVLFGGVLSNIVFSKQDNQVPVVNLKLLLDFQNLNSLPIPFSAYDEISQSVKEAVLYYRPSHNVNVPWRLFRTKILDSNKPATNLNPLEDNIVFIVPDTLGDGPYEFYISARDTAWAPNHRPDQPFAGTEGNIFIPLNNTTALKQIFIDSHKPLSSITSPLNRILNNKNIPIEYTARDSSTGHYGYQGSGVNKSSLYINYKKDQGSLFEYQDSLFTSKFFDTPLLTVTGNFNFFAEKDGYYEFYTLVGDTAKNGENDWNPKTTNLPFVFIDTSVPDIDSISVFEKVSSNPHPAESGWTKNRIIDYKVFGTEDIEKDGYSSGLDSLFLAQNIDFNQNLLTVVAQTVLIEGEYELDEIPGSKTIFAEVTDKADNSSQIVSKQITFDPVSPQITNFDIPYKITTQRDIFVSISLQDNFTLDSLFIWMNGSLVSSILLPEEGQFNSDIPLILPEEFDWHYYTALVRDKAGNISTIAQDSVKLSNAVVLSDLELHDQTPASNQYLGADLGYTNDSRVTTNVTYQGILLKIQTSEDPSFTTFSEYLPSWNVISSTAGDTTISMDFDLSQTNGLKKVYIRGFGPQLSDTSNVLNANIILDSTEPIFNDFIVYHVIDQTDTTFQYTQTRNVKVKIESPDEDVSKIVFWEDDQDSVLYQSFSFDTTYSLKSPDDGLILFNAGIRDRAGNWSLILQRDVYLDRRLPILESLTFDNIYASTFQVKINLEAKDDTLFSGIGALEKVRFSENKDFPPNLTHVFNLPETTAFSGTFDINLDPVYGPHTVYAQVRDKAGNWSSALNSQIEIVEIVQPQELLLLDTTPMDQVEYVAYPGWSNSDTVQTQIVYRGVLKQIIVAKNPSFTLDKTVIDTWKTVNDSTISFNFDFMNVEGSVGLWIKLLGPNLTDTSSTISGKIQIDKTSPTLSEISLFQVQTSGDSLFEFTNKDEIEIEFKSPSETLTHSFVHEAGSDAQLFEVNSPSILYKFDSSTNELKTVFTSVRDSAGNWSIEEYMDSIVLDSQAPLFTEFILSDETKLGIADSLLTDDLKIEITFQTSDIQPGKLFRLIVAQDQNISSNRQTFIFGTNQIQQSTGKFTAYYNASNDYVVNNAISCWAVVEDSALNQSIIFKDEIILTEKLLIQVILFDLTDQTDSLFSDSQTIRLEVRETSGVYEEIAFAESIIQLDNWQHVTTGDIFTTEYFFDSTSPFFEGKLYVTARNSADQSVLDSAFIQIDKVLPSVGNVSVVATSPSGELEYSNNRDVKIQVNINDTGILKQIQLSEDSLFTSFTSVDVLSLNLSSFQEEVEFELSETNGTKWIFVRAMDAAENIGISGVGTIIADYDPVTDLTNHPNPFNPTFEPTTIIVKTSGSTGFEVNIYDLFGNHVRKIDVPSGERYNQVVWDGRNGNGETVANGGYICVVEADSKTVTRKIAVIK